MCYKVKKGHSLCLVNFQDVINFYLVPNNQPIDIKLYSHYHKGIQVTLAIRFHSLIKSECFFKQTALLHTKREWQRLSYGLSYLIKFPSHHTHTHIYIYIGILLLPIDKCNGSFSQEWSFSSFVEIQNGCR